MRVGVILPSFDQTVEPSLRCAREAEQEGIHGVFAYDHLWPMGAPGEPAIEPFVLLGRIAAETPELLVGTLVARIGLVSNDVLLGEFRTLDALSRRRVIAGLGTGDHLSADENRAYGIAFEPAASRRLALGEVAATLVDDGVEVWIGAGSPSTNALARETGSTLNFFGTGVDLLARSAAEGPVSWAGPLPRRAERAAALLAAVAAAGATWAVVSSPTPIGEVAKAARSSGLELGD